VLDGVRCRQFHFTARLKKMINLKLFDHYSLRARLQPALLTLLPAAVAIFAWTGPGVKWQSALWTLFGTAGGTYFLAILARNFGKGIEPGLWQSWGGAPTTQLLRHSGLGNPIMRERWHKYLSKLLGKEFPTAQEEAADPASAENIYGAGIKLLINKTRDTKKFHLVYKENVHYGYCRNLYAMRGMGVSLSVLGLIASCGAAFWDVHTANFQIYPWVCGAAELLLLVWWLFTIKPSWVRIPAFAYAERLLESTENLSRTKSGNPDKK
jgi:hypothetical protein